jgi:glycosyltransferase involved in cell wall biosynthesis
MTIAWFSPLPPSRSGIAAYSAEVLPRLGSHVIDSYPEHAAHDFVWRTRRHPYDLVVYQLGNARYHDYMWAYLATYPGLVVLHDARLHHARARRLLDQQRVDDYRREFRYDHPSAPADFAEYAVAGLGGTIYYCWSMLRVVMQTARSVAVHNDRVAADLRAEFPDTPIDTIRMGVPPPPASPDARARIRREHAIPDDAIVFAAFGKVTAEKRIGPILRAMRALAAEQRNVYLMLVGEDDGYKPLEQEIAGIRDRVRVTGYVTDEAIGEYLAAADACLCLRWPTAQETSAAWLRCLASARATVITDLAHMADVPDDAARRVDLWDEDASLANAMRALASDQAMRDRVARAGHAYWAAHHTLDAMATDYERVLTAAASRRAPVRADLPEHFTADYSGRANAIAAQLGVTIDVLRNDDRRITTEDTKDTKSIS